MVALGDLRAVPVLGGEFKRGLEEVNEQAGGSVETSYCSCRCETFEAPVPQQLAHDGSIFLFDPRLVVLAIWARTGKFDPTTEAVFDQPVVHKLGSVVDVQRLQGKRQSGADALKCFDHQASLADDYGGGLSPSTGNIGQHETIHVAAPVDRATMSNQIHLHAARTGIIPVRKGAHFDPPAGL